MNGYDAWKTTPPWNKPADCPHASEDDCTCDDYVAKCDNCGATDRPLQGSPETREQWCEPCLADIRSNAAFDANPLGFAAKRSLLLYMDTQPFGSALLSDLTFHRGNGMAFWKHYLAASAMTLLVSEVSSKDPRHWKLTDFGWEVNLGHGLGTITPESELPAPIAELLALIAERGARS